MNIILFQELRGPGIPDKYKQLICYKTLLVNESKILLYCTPPFESVGEDSKNEVYEILDPTSNRSIMISIFKTLHII